MPAEKPENLGSELSAYVDGELPPQRAAQLERELAESAELRAELEQLRAASAAVTGLPRLRAPAALRERLSHATRPSKATDGRLFVLRWCVRMTAAAAVIGGGVLVAWEAVRDQQADQPTVLREQQLHASQEAAPTRDVDMRSALQFAARDENPVPQPSALHAMPESAAERVGLAPPATVAPPVGAAVRPADAAAPVVTVSIQPRTRGEYAAAYAALEEWRASVARGEAVNAAEPGRHEAVLRVRGETLERAEPAAVVSFEEHVPVADLGQVVGALERQLAAPLEVEVAAQGRAFVWRSSDVAAAGRMRSRLPAAAAPPAARPASGGERGDGAEGGLVEADAPAARSDRVAGAAPRESKQRGKLGAKDTQREAAGLVQRPQTASASTSQSQPIAEGGRREESDVQKTLSAWLDGLARSGGDGQGAVRLGVRLLPPAPVVEDAGGIGGETAP